MAPAAVVPETGPRRHRPAHHPEQQRRGLAPRAWAAAVAALRGGRGVAVVSGLATLFSWRDLPWRVATAGLSSWQAGLALAYDHHLEWGPQMVFTFGPYGFVEDVLPFFRFTAALGLAYALVITWGLAALMVSALRRSWALVPAGVAAWAAVTIAANLLEAPELALATALGLALASVWAESERRRLVLMVALSALAGAQLLVEVNVGLVTLALAVLSLLALPSPTPSFRPGRRAPSAVAGPIGLAAWCALSFVLVVLAGLLAAGQNVANVASYGRGALAVAWGYSSAMSLSAGRVAEDWYAIADSAVVVLLFALAVRDRARRTRLVVAVMVAGWGWEALKEGFVRHDMHDLVYLGLLLLAVGFARLPRRLVPLQASGLAVAALLACLANAGVPASLHSPVEDTRALVDEVRDLVGPHWARVQFIARYQVRVTGDALPRAMVAALAGHSVAAEPFEDALSFAYPELRWDPEPVLQSYSAYTSYLDSLDARFLSSPRAPQYILFAMGSIDDRDPAWDPPAAMIAMYCHYRQVTVDAGWQVLERTPDRCRPARPLITVRARFGQLVSVPTAPGDLVVASFSLNTPLLSRVESVLLKAPSLAVTTWPPTGGRPTSYRFLPGTAADAHIVGVPARLGYAPGYGPTSVGRLTVTGGGWAAGQGQVEVSFSAVPISGA